MALRPETIEKIRKARENRDPEEAKRFTASLPEARPLAEGETMVIFGPPKAKPEKAKDSAS